MNCPVCNVELKMADRQGVEIDYCPRCRGVWLDRGELDKIIERSETGFEASSHQPQHQQRRDSYSEHERGEHNRYSDDDSYYRQQQQQQQYPYKKHKKRESFLSNLFDFD